MLGGLVRSASGASAPSSAPLQLLFQQSPSALQGLSQWGSCIEPSCRTSDVHDRTGAPSTSTSGAPLAGHDHHAHGPHHHFPQQLQAQQLRFYRIPNRVLQPVVSYSERSGRPPPQPWPAFESFRAPPGELRWHRSVVRFPAEVTVELQGAAASAAGSGSGRVLAISGKAGTIRLNLEELDPTGLLAFRLVHLPPAPAPAAAGGAPGGAPASGSAAPGGGGRSLLVLASPDKARFEAVGGELNRAIRGVMSGYLLGLTVKGVGYRMEPVEGEGDEGAQGPSRSPALTLAQRARRARDPDGGKPKSFYFEPTSVEKQNVTYPFNKPALAIRLKVGYSRTAVYPLPPHVRAFFLKPTLLYLYGLELDELQRVAAEIRSIRKPNPYTGNGVQYVDEVVKLKARKGGK